MSRSEGLGLTPMAVVSADVAGCVAVDLATMDALGVKEEAIIPRMADVAASHLVGEAA